MGQENRLIPNSTQIPNVISDLIESRIAEGEMRCLKYICRRTYGFHKERDRISLSQFVDGLKDKNGKRLDYGTGLSRPSVVEALRNLAGSNIINVIRTTKGNYYEINLKLFENKNPNEVADEVVKKVNQLRKLTRTGKESKPKQVKLLNLQKKGKQRETKSYTADKVGRVKNNCELLVDYFLELKNWDDQPKEFYKKNNIRYSRYLRPAKQVLELYDGNLEKAKVGLDKTKNWVSGFGGDFTIETCIKYYTYQLK